MSPLALYVGAIVVCIVAVLLVVLYNIAKERGAKTPAPPQRPASEEKLSPACCAANAESELNPLHFSRYGYAAAVLGRALKKTGYCVWEVPESGEAYKIGIRFGVNLDWPELSDEGLRAQYAEIREICIATGRSLNFLPVMDSPSMYAGGVMAMLCGFREKPFIEADPPKPPVYPTGNEI